MRTLFEDQEDPFGGNENNRRVAERMSKLKQKLAKPAEPVEQEIKLKLTIETDRSVTVSKDDGTTNEPIAPVVDTPVAPVPQTAAEKKTAKAAAKVAAAAPPVWKP